MIGSSSSFILAFERAWKTQGFDDENEYGPRWDEHEEAIVY